MLPLTSNLALISECSRGLRQNSILPFGLVTNRSLNSVYPLSLAARKNACKVEWWLSVNRDLLLILTLQPEIRKCSPAKLMNSSKGSYGSDGRYEECQSRNCAQYENKRSDQL